MNGEKNQDAVRKSEKDLKELFWVIIAIIIIANMRSCFWCDDGCGSCSVDANGCSYTAGCNDGCDDHRNDNQGNGCGDNRDDNKGNGCNGDRDSTPSQSSGAQGSSSGSGGQPSPEEVLVNNFLFNVVYNSQTDVKQSYHVVTNSQAQNRLEEEVANNSNYSNVVKTDGKIASYTFDSYQRNVFYGTIEQFNDYLLKQNILDEENKKFISQFNISETSNQNFVNYYGGDYYNSSNTINRQIYAVWQDCKEVTLRGYTDVKVYVGAWADCVLPESFKPGYKFVGWYSSSDFSGNQITKVAYTDSFSELFAKFEKVDHYTLTFEPFNGQMFENMLYSYGDSVQLPVLTKSFYIFEGWCTDKECQTPPLKSITSTFYGDYHMYPCFTPRKYNVTLINEGSSQTVQLAYGEEYTLPVAETEDPNKKFIGYYDVSGVRYTDENGKGLTPFTDGAEIQLYARYKEEEE